MSFKSCCLALVFLGDTSSPSPTDTQNLHLFDGLCYSTCSDVSSLCRSVKLPLEDGSVLNETDVLFPTSLQKDLIYGPVLPLSAIAGLVGEEAETFRVITLLSPRLGSGISFDSKTAGNGGPPCLILHHLGSQDPSHMGLDT